MVVDGINILAPSRKAEGIPRVRNIFSLSVEKEQDGVERDGRTCLARPNSRTGTRNRGKTSFFCSVDHEQHWQPFPVDPYSAISDDHSVRPVRAMYRFAVIQNSTIQPQRLMKKYPK